MVCGDDLGLTAAGRWLISGGESLWTAAIRISGETGLCSAATRSEERRVGKECRSRWSPYH